MQKYYNNVISSSGKPVQGASVAVSLLSGGTATIYSDNGVTTTTNPLTTDQYGQFSFYAADGRYSFSVTANGVVAYSFTDVILEDPQDSLTYSDTGIVASFSSTTAGYNQIVLQNKSAASNASANFNISNNAATATTNFLEMGMNSSGFTGPGSFGQPSYGYLASASTDLAIGTYASNSIHFVVNSGTADAVTIDTSGNLIPKVNTSAPSLTVNGQMVFALTSNTNLRVSVRGSDGVTRVANLTLA